MISVVISAIPQAGKRGVDTRDVFVTKQEAFQDALYLTTVGQLNEFATQVNSTADSINDAAETVQPIFANIDDVVAVGENISSVEAVADDMTNVNTVSGSISNVNLVGTNITSVNTVSSSITNVNTVSGSIANVNLVGTNITSVNTVNNDISAVVAVADAIQGGTLPTIIDDTGISIVATWSSSKIDTAKQNVLVSGTSIKTINGSSLLGSGDIEVPVTTVNDTLTSTSTTEALSANQGRVLNTEKLSKSGGTMTGAITAIRETKVAMATNNIDLATGNLFTKTITGATALTISNALASGNVNSFVLELTNAGSAVITWFSGVKWAGGTAPTLTASGKDILGFYSHDGGTTWNILGINKDVK